MEFIIEILIECFLELITDGGMEVMSGSELTRRWPRGVKIALVIITLLIFGAVIIGMTVMGILFLIKGDLAPGLAFLLIGIALLFMILFGIWRKIRKNRNNSV